MVRESLCNCSISLTDKLLSDHMQLNSSRTWGSALIAFTEKEPRINNLSNVVTVLKAT